MDYEIDNSIMSFLIIYTVVRLDNVLGFRKYTLKNLRVERYDVTKVSSNGSEKNRYKERMINAA